MEAADEWKPYADGTTIGTRGSEDGTVVVDQEYRAEARITLERDGAVAPYAITCGIYGWMVHTRVAATLEEAMGLFGDMKDDLERMMGMDGQQWGESDEGYQERINEATRAFVERYW